MLAFTLSLGKLKTYHDKREKNKIEEYFFPYTLPPINLIICFSGEMEDIKTFL